MSLECPNCREPVSFLRSIRTTAWGSFPCRFCGSVLAISFARRMIAAGVWVAALLFAMGVWGLHRRGPLITYPAMVVALIAIFRLFERIVLVERRAFTCKQCGYNLQGLPENRCPECGTTFDPAERERILARIASPRPKPRHRWIAVLVVILLALALVVGMVTYRKASRAAAGRAATPATQPAPIPSPSGE